MDSILSRVARKVTPSAAERKAILKVIDRSIKAAIEVTNKHGLGYTLAGSFIRDTWMPDKKEFEIFLLFPESVGREELEKTGLDAGIEIVEKLEGRHVIAYAEHPYVRARVGEYDIDIVPCYRLKSAKKIKSSVDRTPFHNRWIEKNLRGRMSTEVRLLKRFTKSLGIYGSDTRVQGFSGYLCELLIIHYWSFKKLLADAAGWEPGKVVIDIEKHHEGNSLPPELRDRFKGQPLVVIDPVDSKRNVAAAFSPQNFARFVLACERFMKSPSEAAFFPRAPTVRMEELRKAARARGTELLLVTFERPDFIDDVVWPQLRRTAKRLKDFLQEQGFLVMDWAVHSDHHNIMQRRNGRSYMLLELGVWELPKVRKVIGPPVFIKARSGEFKKKYEKDGKVWVEGDRLVAEVERKYLRAGALLEDALAASPEKMRSIGIASHLAKSIGNGFGILRWNDALKLARNDKDFKLFLWKYVQRDL